MAFIFDTDDSGGESLLEQICIGESFSTSFLGLESKNPEAVLTDLGFVLKGKRRRSTWWGKGNFFANVKREDSGKLVEVYYGRGDEKSMRIDYEPIRKIKSVKNYSSQAGFLYIRERYLDMAEKSKWGLEPFLRLCALASLDLSCEDVVLGGAFSNLYPELYRDGLATCIYRGDHRQWQFLHPGLAKMILETAARARGTNLLKC